MEAILKFNLNDYDDAAAHLRAVKSLDLILCLNDFDNELRAKLKYGELDDDVYKIYSEIRSALHESMNKYDINVDKLLI